MINFEKIKLTVFTLFIFLFPFTITLSQDTSDEEMENDPVILKKLEWFQDQKFGFFMHWGPYSQWGVTESWTICSRDEEWIHRKMDNYNEYCEAYFDLNKTFNPTKFDPDKWAQIAEDAGMKYVVFTTKHHDGFCMFDTKQTNYKITDTTCPFHLNPKANITKEIFTSFRKKGFGVGAYFSKPDWHSPYYWSPNWAHADHNVNYKIKNHPDLWQKFCDYTYNQIEELATDYGKLDILWLDGGWVRPLSAADEVRADIVREMGGEFRQSQNINMPKIAEMARSHQRDILIVDRTVTGKYENYRTPEQEIPDEPLPYPWETCLTLGHQWSYKPNDNYKSAHRMIHILVDIVSKGGNLLLNVGPDPNGELPAEAVKRLKEIGEWLKINGTAIYNTRPVAPYKEGKICFTKKDDKSLYAIYLLDEDETTLPNQIFISTLNPSLIKRITTLGRQSNVTFTANGKGTVIQLKNETSGKYAAVFNIEMK